MFLNDFFSLHKLKNIYIFIKIYNLLFVWDYHD